MPFILSLFTCLIQVPSLFYYIWIEQVTPFYLVYLVLILLLLVSESYYTLFCCMPTMTNKVSYILHLKRMTKAI